jgi:hypothetical protein
MKKTLYFLLSVLLFAPVVQASYAPPLTDTTNNIIYLDGIFHLPPAKTIEQYLGRKLTLREKLTLYWYKRHLKSYTANAGILAAGANSDAKLGYIFALLGIACFFFFIPGFILSKKALTLEKEHPGTLTKKNLAHAEAGKTISVVGAIVVATGIILFVFIISSLHLQCR